MVHSQPLESVLSASGLPIKPLYRPEDIADLDYKRDLGDPGQPPYTRGIYPEMYRRRPWAIRPLAGFATAEDTNARCRWLLAEGATGVNVTIDYSTLRDAGMEVIYLGNQTPEAIAREAIEEDVDVVGRSCMSGSHLLYARGVTEVLGTGAPDPSLSSSGGSSPMTMCLTSRQQASPRCSGPGDPLATIVDAVRRVARRTWEG